MVTTKCHNLERSSQRVFTCLERNHHDPSPRVYTSDWNLVQQSRLPHTFGIRHATRYSLCVKSTLTIEVGLQTIPVPLMTCWVHVKHIFFSATGLFRTCKSEREIEFHMNKVAVFGRDNFRFDNVSITFAAEGRRKSWPSQRRGSDAPIRDDSTCDFFLFFLFCFLVVW